MTAKVVFGDGKSIGFFRTDLSPTAAWTAAVGANRLIATTNPTTDQPSGYKLTLAADDSRWYFDSAGKLLDMALLNGHVTHYVYSTATTSATVAPAPGYLIRVINSLGRSLSFTYNPTGQLNTVTTPDGQTLSYQFDDTSATSRLTTVSYPGPVSGTVSKTYHYEDLRWPQSVTGFTDERGIRVATVVYDTQGRAVESGYAGGADYYKVAYPAPEWVSVNGGGSYVTPPKATVTDPLGTVRTYNYGTTQGKLAVVGADKPSGTGTSDAASRVQNAFGLVEKETDFLGIISTTTWDTTRRLPTASTQAVDLPEQTTTTTTWHATWSLPTQVVESGRTTDTTYYPTGNVKSETITDTTGGPSNGEKRTWSWTYTAKNLVETQTDPRGNITRYTYNSANQRKTSTDALGYITTYDYDSAGRLSTITEPNGLLSTYTYDPRSRVRSITISDSTVAKRITPETTSYTYTAAGQLETITEPSGVVTTYSYDNAQRLVGASDNRGNTWVNTLDGMGNATRQDLKDSSGTIVWTTSRSINALNRVTSITNASGQSTTLGYDDNGSLTSQTDALAHTTSQTLDGLRRPKATTLADNNTTQTSWNALSQVTAFKDPKGISTTYVRNAWGEVLKETSPDSGVTTYERYPTGQVRKTTDALGQVSTYTRDALGQVTQIDRTSTSGPNSGQTRTHTLSYDSMGNLLTMQDNSGASTYTYDLRGRLLSKTQSVADNPANPSTTTTRYAYHPGGTLAQITYPSGLNVYYRLGSNLQVGQITQVDIQQPPKSGVTQPIVPWLTALQTTAWGQPKSWSWNCINTAGSVALIGKANCDSASRSFDSNGRLRISEIASFTYDAASRVASVTQNLQALQDAVPADPKVVGSVAIPATPYVASILWYTDYDSRDRLTAFYRKGANHRLSYDANSNRLSSLNRVESDTDLAGNFDQSNTTSTSYLQANSQAPKWEATSNRLLGYNQKLMLENPVGTVVSTTYANVAYTLDAAGNLSSDGLRQFSYDLANRLSSVQIGQSNEASKITYLHNSAGQRVFKSEPQVAQLAPNSSNLGDSFITWLQANFGWLFAQAQVDATLGQSYVYADGALGSYNLLGEYGNGGSQSQGRTEYIWLPAPTGQGQPAQLIGIYQNNRFYAAHTDHLGTPRRITDDAAQVVWQWSYSAFGDNPPSGPLKSSPKTNGQTGNVLKATAPLITMNLRMSGQYFDGESGLFYNYQRSYRPAQGRYDQFDPSGLSAGWNGFIYVGNNPLMFTDPKGLIAVPSVKVPAPVPTPAPVSPSAEPNMSPRTDICMATPYDNANKKCQAECLFELDMPGRRDNFGPYRACLRRCLARQGFAI